MARNKYFAKKVVVGDEKYDSKKEYNRHLELKLLEKSGNIKSLERQIRFEVFPKQEKGGWYKRGERAIFYVTDFVYYDNDKQRWVCEDTKGYITEIYKIKRKLFKYRYPEYELIET